MVLFNQVLWPDIPAEFPVWTLIASGSGLWCELAVSPPAEKSRVGIIWKIDSGIVSVFLFSVCIYSVVNPFSSMNLARYWYFYFVF